MAFGSLVRRSQEVSINLVDAIRKAYVEDRSKEPLTGDDWLRVSAIGQMCEREEVLCSIHGIPRRDRIDGDSGMNFEHGHAVHWMFQTKVLPSTGLIIGSWRCTYCGEVYGNRATRMVPRPSRCTRCGAIAGEAPRSNGRPDTSVNDSAFLFCEEWLGNEQYKIGGSPDGQMIAGYTPDYRDEDLTLLEFKSCNDRNFYKYKDAPDFAHVIQAQLYLWLTGYKRVKIVYFNKNDRGTLGIREHDMDRDDECLETVLAAVKTVREGVQHGSVPPRTVCANRDCSRAFNCQVRDICFKD